MFLLQFSIFKKKKKIFHVHVIIKNRFKHVMCIISASSKEVDPTLVIGSVYGV